jgi:phosphorylcholine metabolism protein LicD
MDMAIADIIKKYFSSECGFGSSKQLAIDLLKQTICMLEEFNINYFLISGTLLGYVRHNDFIPWDDDIDLIVDSIIFEKMPEIAKKYGDEINFVVTNYIIKTCFKNRGTEINCSWTDRMLNKGDKYNWPFIDLFFYSSLDDTHIMFFRKKWNIEHFFPLDKVSFNGITVNIPKNPHYFLERNYGKDYMTVLKASKYSHKTEKHIRENKTISMSVYMEYKNPKT